MSLLTLPYLAPARLGDEPDPDAERARRVAIYAAAVRKTEGTTAKHTRVARPVRCVDTNKDFQSTRAAARWLSQRLGRPITRSALRTALARGERCAGYAWSYTTSQPRRVIPSAMGIPVRCVQTGQMFPSISAAAASIEVSEKTMRDAIRSGRPLVGSRFERVQVTPQMKMAA